jgi:hypothetical protein
VGIRHSIFLAGAVAQFRYFLRSLDGGLLQVRHLSFRFGHVIGNAGLFWNLNFGLVLWRTGDRFDGLEVIGTGIVDDFYRFTLPVD